LPIACDLNILSSTNLLWLTPLLIKTAAAIFHNHATFSIQTIFLTRKNWPFTITPNVYQYTTVLVYYAATSQFPNINQSCINELTRTNKPSSKLEADPIQYSITSCKVK